MTILNGNFRHYELDNGLVVGMQNTPSQTVVGILRVNYGASHERPDERGYAHFLEHCLAAAGSDKYSPLQVEAITDNIGYFNANTNIGRTTFPMGSLSEDLELWLELVSGFLFNPRFDPERVEGERRVVLREIADHISNPHYETSRQVIEALSRGHPTGIEVCGDSKSIADASIEKLKIFHQRGYSATNMDLILVGDLPNNAEKLVEIYFGNKERGNNTRTNFPVLSPLEKKTVLHLGAPELINKKNPRDGTAHINLHIVVPPENDPDSYGIRGLAYILGGENLSSRLNRNLRLKKGLAYSCGVHYSGDYNAGILSISAKVPALKIEESLDTIFEEITRLRKEKISEMEARLGKKNARYRIANGFDSNWGHLSAIGIKLDDNITVEEIMEAYQRLTPEIVRETALKYLPESRERGKYILEIRDPLKK